MRRLMILGGTHYIIPVIQKAHELGVYVITCDYLPGNIAHKYSDKYCNVSVIDKDAVLTAAKSLKVDGVISFACDPGVVSAAYTAEKMGLPFQGPYESVRILQDKGLFRKFLAAHGFNAPHARRYTDKSAPLSDTEAFTWPVMVKPVDSAGSKGVNRVDSPEELAPAIETAVQESHNGAFIIEDFLQFVGQPTDSDHFTENGKLTFSEFDEQFFDTEAANPYTPAKYIFPSRMKKDHQKILHDDIQRLMTLLKMHTGLYNIETRIASDGRPCIMEVSPRGGGNKLAELEDMAYGACLVENEIRSAVNMPLNDSHPHEISGCWCEMVIHARAGQSGFFRRLNVDSDIMTRYVKLVALGVSEGARVRPFTGANAALGNMFLHFNDREELEKVMSSSHEWMNIELSSVESLTGGGAYRVTVLMLISPALDEWRNAA